MRVPWRAVASLNIEVAAFELAKLRAEVERLRARMDRARAALLLIWPKGEACEHVHARESFKELAP